MNHNLYVDKPKINDQKQWPYNTTWVTINQKYRAKYVLLSLEIYISPFPI